MTRFLINLLTVPPSRYPDKWKPAFLAMQLGFIAGGFGLLGRDLLLILEANLIKLESEGLVRSGDVIYTKIQKIRSYLETGIDPEFQFSNQFSVLFFYSIHF